MDIKKLLEEKKKMLFKKQEKYQIPPRHKIAEIELLQNDRDLMYKEMNYKIDKIVGETLQELYEYENEEYLTGIHRTSANKDDIFKNGIEYKDGTDIHDHVQMFKNFTFMLREISHCEGYKFSRGCFIIKVPKSSVEGLMKDAEPIYYKAKNGKIYLRPEYISAYVPVSNKNLGMVQFNQYPHNIYDETTEFLYDENMLGRNKSYGFINIFLINLIIISISILVMVLKQGL